jgi:peroxin-7
MVNYLLSNVKRFDTQQGVYDAAWSEVHENQLVVACGDNTIKLFDITLQVTSTFF